MRRLAAALAALFLSFVVSLPALAACEGLNLSIESDMEEASPDSTVTLSSFLETKGDCADVSLKVLLVDSAGTIHQLANQACPSGSCRKTDFTVNGTEQHTNWSYEAQLTPKNSAEGLGNLIVEASSGGTLLLKSVPTALTIKGTGVSAAPPPEKPLPKPLEVTLAVAIGGLTTTGSIATYISTLYNWVIGIVSVFAISMVVWGGAKYLTAGADPSRLKSAKETIGNAFIGLLLALSSYLILSTVNPALLKFKELSLPPVSRFLQQPEAFCEEIMAKQGGVFTLDPPTGQCGSKGKLLGKPGGTQPNKPECTFKACPAGKACADVGKDGFKCTNCNDWTFDKLQLAGVLNPTNDDCRRRGAYQVVPKSHAITCVYVNDTVFQGAGCSQMSVNCKNITKCEDYHLHTVREGGSDPINWVASGGESGVGVWDVSYERRCAIATEGGAAAGALYGATKGGVPGAAVGAFAGWVSCPLPSSPGHIAMFCNEDPCGVGPCEEKANTRALSALASVTGVELTPTRIAYCCPQGVDCTEK